MKAKIKIVTLTAIFLGLTVCAQAGFWGKLWCYIKNDISYLACGGAAWVDAGFWCEPILDPSLRITGIKCNIPWDVDWNALDKNLDDCKTDYDKDIDDCLDRNE